MVGTNKRSGVWSCCLEDLEQQLHVRSGPSRRPCAHKRTENKPPPSVSTGVLAAERVLVLEETDWASLVLMEPRWSAVKTSRGNGVDPAHPGAGRVGGGGGGEGGVGSGCAESGVTGQTDVRSLGNAAWEGKKRRRRGFQCQEECPAGEEAQMLQSGTKPPPPHPPPGLPRDIRLLLTPTALKLFAFTATKRRPLPQLRSV